MMTALPDGYRLRHPSADDLPAVQDLLDAAESADAEEPCRHDMDVVVIATTTLLDLEHDSWVVVAPDGAMAGCGWLWQPRRCDTEFIGDHYVHPDHRERPVDDALIDAIEGRVRERRAECPALTRLVLFSESSNARRCDSLCRRGFEYARDFYNMGIDLAPNGAPVAWPAGVAVRVIRPEVDAHAAHAAHEDAFAEHYLHAPALFADWRALTLDREDFDASLWLLAWDGTEIAGEVWAVERDQCGAGVVGVIESLAVRKPWRGRGLGEALLREIFRLLGDRGRATARLWVDAQNATGALRVYERAGMHVARHILVFGRPLE
jgi:mycothiol synthase